ncbi:uncharacterized protein C8A04DRAFT_13458 [Dichotomopilus funicola]|uniref:ABM domain-containing protein n=1 Tax=Dichotomopilus funicola TaxID=1934379 RepID=A0AAN6ZLB9_9PEZI|nr:hypothetical protein C8A04DRAFT_13458 [Dichotomopilus funicola]
MAIHLLAIMSPKPEKLARLEELAQALIDSVKQNEPGVTKYQWFRSGSPEEPKVVVYADAEAFKVHKKNPKLGDLVKRGKEEGLFAAPMQLLPLEQFAGFAAVEGAKI